MKLFSSILVLAVSGISLAAPAGAQKLTCREDMRPLDGALNQVTLTRQTDGKYEAVYVHDVRMVAPGEHKEIKIFSGVDCKFATKEPTLVECNGTSDGEFAYLRVVRSSKESVTYDGSVDVSTFYEIHAQSSTLDKAGLDLSMRIQQAPRPAPCKAE